MFPNIKDEFLREYFSDDDIREIKLSASVESVLEQLQTTDPLNVANILLNSSVVTTYEGVFKLCCNMMEYMENCPKNQLSVAQLMHHLISFKGPNNCLDQIKSTIGDFVTNVDYTPNYVHVRLTQLYYFVQFWRELTFTEEEIVQLVERNFYQCPISEYTTSYYFVFFQDIIKKYDPKFYEKAKKMHQSLINMKRVLCDAFRNPVNFTTESWQNLENAVKEGAFPDPIVKMIWDDDIESFKEISSQENFDFNQQIKNVIFLPLSSAMRSSNLIEYAAFNGASKIFHYLLEKNCDVKAPSKNLYTIAQLAGIGGDVEIIKTLARIGVSSKAMFGREDGHYVKVVFQQYVQQMLVSYHARMVGEDGNPFPLQDGKILRSLFVTHYDSLLS